MNLLLPSLATVAALLLIGDPALRGHGPATITFLLMFASLTQSVVSSWRRGLLTRSPRQIADAVAARPTPRLELLLGTAVLVLCPVALWLCLGR